MKEADFLKKLKTTFGTKVLRHTALTGKTISKMALCGGAGVFLLNDAIRQQADAFITADIKYHQFFDAEGKILLCDVGHYESEQFTNEIFLEILNKKFPTFATLFSKISTNPVNYY
jgi:putative NIF3 family GTP cyclohydrolase 1 type 2